MQLGMEPVGVSNLKCTRINVERSKSNIVLQIFVGTELLQESVNEFSQVICIMYYYLLQNQKGKKHSLNSSNDLGFY